jgi:hypothetical protein
MANFVLPIATEIAKYYQRKFVNKTRQTERIQLVFLKQVLRTHQNTLLGRQYNLGEIESIEQFRDRVPVLPYSNYEPFTDLIARGEPNVLTSEPVVYLTLTSGSTGKKKLIPTTRKSQNIVRQATLTSIGFIASSLPKVDKQFGKLLVTNSVQTWGKTEGKIDYGPSSAGVLRMDNRIYKNLFAHPYETLLTGDSLARHYVCLLFALADSETKGMLSNFPMLILRTCNYLEKYAEDLIQDLETGAIASWLSLEPEVRSQLEKQFNPTTQRAKYLREIYQAEGKLTPELAWKNFSFVATARGGTSDFYFERFPEYFGQTPIFGAVYSSAEGIFSIYPDVNNDGSILAIDCCFFEFIPQDQWEVEHPKTLLATEVNVGEYYRILITNFSGFYRYDIGDVVEVVGFYEQAPLLVFRYRRGGFISSTTEKTTEFHATQVMQSLQQQFNLKLEDFCITLSGDEFPSRYLIYIELNNEVKLEDPEAFLDNCDRKLQEVNTHYQISRKDPIPPPRLRILAPGSFGIIRQRQLQKGIPDSQLKFPHISEDRNFMAGLTVEREIRLPEDH